MNNASEPRNTPLAKPRSHKLRRAARISLVVLIAHSLGVITSIHALMVTRTAPGTVAWIVSLNTFPWGAVPAYWIFGRSKFKGYVKLREQFSGSLDQSLSGELDRLAPFRTLWPAGGQPFRAVEKLARLPFVDGNQVELLIDGKETFASIFDGIDLAQEYLLVQFYIVRADEQGVNLQQRLIARAKAGVRVYLLFDELGSIELPHGYIAELVAAGVQVESFNSTRGLTNKFQYNFRNHRKLVVADGKQAWVGGLNVGNEYQGPSWRDTHLRIEGPAVLHLQLSFLEDWRWATSEMPELQWQPHVGSDPAVPVLILPTGPADRFETASLMIQQVIHLADRRFWVASPYFVPDEGVVASLKLAALSGVDVRILLPEAGDSLLAELAAFTFIDALTEAGVRIYRYQPGLMHGKFFLFDDIAAAVSTVNLDNRSLRLNFELTALVVDRDFTLEVAAMFEADFENSVQVEKDTMADKPFWFQVGARAANLFAPAL